MTKHDFHSLIPHDLRLSFRQAWNERPNDGLQARVELGREIASKAYHGKVAMVESGMDCDCVRYSGIVRMIPASIIAWVHATDQAYYNAEGPISLYMVTPEEGRKIKYHSRDLAAEAYEDGHPGIIYT